MNLKDLFSEENMVSSENGTDVFFLLKRLARNWYWILLSLSISVGLCSIYLYFQPAIYEIKSSLLINTDERGAEFSQNIVLDDLEKHYSSKVVENEIEVLTSVNLIQLVLEELGLQNSFYVANGFLRKREIFGDEVPIYLDYKELNQKAINVSSLHLEFIDNEYFYLVNENGTKKRVKYGEALKNNAGVFSIRLKDGTLPLEIPEELEVGFNHIRELAFDLKDEINAEPTNKLSTAVAITFYDPIPERGEEIVNKLVELYNKRALESLSSTAENTIEFIDLQMGKLTEDLGDIELKIEEFKKKYEISDLSSESQLFLESTRGNKQMLSEYQIKIDVLSDIIQELESGEDSYKVLQGIMIVEDQSLSDMINDFNQMLRERQRLMKTVNPSNPLLKNLESQIQDLRIDIIESAKNDRRSLQIAVNNLEETGRKTDERVGKVPLIERELLNLTRDQGIKQENYLYLMKKREEAMLSSAATSGKNAKVIDPAMAGIYPVRPLKKFLLFGSLILGFAIPLSILMVSDKLFGKITQKSDLERLTKTPLLGEVARSKKSNIYLNDPTQRSIIGEQVSLIWSNLKFAVKGDECKVLATTSSVGGEGKTFFTIQMARVMAASGKKVAVLEFDLRKPAMLEKLKLKREKGVADYLEDENLKIEDVIFRPDENQNISIIGAGQLPDNPMYAMNNPRIKELIEGLKLGFDYVLLDTAPVGLVSDAYTLAPYIDALIYIVRYNFTQNTHVGIINAIFEKSKFNNPFIVLNDAKIEHFYGYGYGYYGEQKRFKKGKAIYQ
jgi:tyrosine-protein kinase Etk/Wzc